LEARAGFGLDAEEAYLHHPHPGFVLKSPTRFAGLGEKTLDTLQDRRAFVSTHLSHTRRDLGMDTGAALQIDRNGKVLLSRLMPSPMPTAQLLDA